MYQAQHLGRFAYAFGPRFDAAMAPYILTILVLSLACMTLSSCAGGHVGDVVPHWMGGLPADAPPRPGTPEYDAWMAKRAQEAARPKTEQQQPK
jgi:hypothetical protein